MHAEGHILDDELEKEEEDTSQSHLHARDYFAIGGVALVAVSLIAGANESGFLKSEQTQKSSHHSPTLRGATDEIRSQTAKDVLSVIQE
jgi:hypothetical protein